MYCKYVSHQISVQKDTGTIHGSIVFIYFKLIVHNTVGL